MKERFERLEETLHICRQMWSDDDGPYNGRHYQLAETICIPRPLQSPRPTILIGGTGEKKTLRFVARYADATNLFDTGAADIRHKLEVLQAHCETEGRDPETITNTVIAGTDALAETDAFFRTMEAYAALGIKQVWVSPPAPDPAGWVTQVTEKVLPRLAELG